MFNDHGASNHDMGPVPYCFYNGCPLSVASDMWSSTLMCVCRFYNVFSACFKPSYLSRQFWLKLLTWFDWYIRFIIMAQIGCFVQACMHVHAPDYYYSTQETSLHICWHLFEDLAEVGSFEEKVKPRWMDGQLPQWFLYLFIQAWLIHII